MKARVGDRVIIADDDERTGVIIAVPQADGSPPYVIKWQSSGHVALVHPGPYARIVPAAGTPAHEPPAAGQGPEGDGGATGVAS